MNSKHSYPISLVFAYGQGPVGQPPIIGIGDRLPWHIKQELQLFKKITSGQAVVMGRKTWDSLPKKPLPGRLNIVVSRQQEVAGVAQATREGQEGAEGLEGLEGSVLVHSLAAAVELAQQKHLSVAVIGGAQIFDLAYPFADIIFASEIAGRFGEGQQDNCYLTIPVGVELEKNFRLVQEYRMAEADIPFVVREYHRHGINISSRLAAMVKSRASAGK
ncbi:MAG: dihydrofolate reductase, partial [Alphaproteobacteria bacterium]|nr:dihydrofolate reductase [Alphaproteobacteria bacterium]